MTAPTSHRRCLHPALAFALAGSGLCLPACAPAEAGVCEIEAAQAPADPVAPGWRAPSGPCRLDPPRPALLVLTTTDHSTGALTTVDLADGRVRPDVAESRTDSLPMGGRNLVPVVHRRDDFVEFFAQTADAGLRSMGQFPVGAERGANPQALVLGPDDQAFVTLYAEPWVEVLDPAGPPEASLIERIDLSAFADADGNPEASLAVACGDTMYVAIARLDPDFRRVDYDGIVAIDMHERRALAPERGALPVRGHWIRQIRRDPADPAETTVLLLTTGIERVDLRTQEVTWAVPEDAFAAAGIDHVYLPQAFAVSEDGTMAYLAAYGPDDPGVACACNWNACFDQVRLYRVGLDGRAPEVPEPFAEGFLSVAQTLELVGDRLYYGSTRFDAPGLWVFDATTDPPRPIEGPIPTGLPPYAMVATE